MVGWQAVDYANPTKRNTFPAVLVDFFVTRSSLNSEASTRKTWLHSSVLLSLFSSFQQAAGEEPDLNLHYAHTDFVLNSI